MGELHDLHRVDHYLLHGLPRRTALQRNVEATQVHEESDQNHYGVESTWFQVSSQMSQMLQTIRREILCSNRQIHLVVQVYQASQQDAEEVQNFQSNKGLQISSKGFRSN